MKLYRVTILVLGVAVLSLGLVGTALAARPEHAGNQGRGQEMAASKSANAERQQNRAVAGSVSEVLNATSFKLKRPNGRTLTVNTAEATFRLPGGKRTAGAITTAQGLRVGDAVRVRGQRTGADTFKAQEVRLTAKTIKRYSGEITALTDTTITLRKDDPEPGQPETKTFTRTGAVVLPAVASLATGMKVHMLYRSTDTATEPAGVAILVNPGRRGASGG